MTTQDVQQIDLALIELSGGTQSRAGYDEQTLTEYVEAWERGVQFPPIDLYRRNGKTYTVNTSFMGSKTSNKTDPTLAPVTDKPQTGWDISPQALTTTVKGHKIAVHFERRGEEFFFGFKGPEHTISASGFHHEQ